VTKKEFKVLEKVFAAEIDGKLYQGKCKTVKKLKKDGYVIEEEKILGRDRFGLIKVKGYRTTLKGHFYYCTNCELPEIVKEEK
jgi:hypothetical protein